MKFKNLFMAVLAGAALLTACQQEENLGTPKISVEPTVLSFGAAEDSSPVQFTATRDWLIASIPEWVALSVDSGKASADMRTITLSVDENTKYNRSGEVVFTIGLAKAVLTVNQEGPLGELPKGSGTLEDPFTVAGVIEYVKDLGSDVQSDQKVYVKGKISEISEAFSAQYGNGTFKMTDDGAVADAEHSFYAYRILYLGNAKWKTGDTQIEVGDDVVVYGNVVYYKGNTPETVQNGAFLYSLNGQEKGGNEEQQPGEAKGSGTLDDPYNPAGANAYIATLAADTNSDKDIYVKGIVSSVKEAYTTQYGNGTFYISEDGTSTAEQFYVFRAYYLNNQKYTSGDNVKVGDEVIICGKVVNYKGNTPETVQNNAYLYSLNGNTGGTTPVDPTPGGDAKAVTVAEFNAAEESSTQVYELVGTIGGTVNGTYGNFDLTDDSGTVYVYGLTATELGYGAKNDQSYGSLGLAAGDKIKIHGYRGSYNGKIEVMYAWFIEKVDGGGETPGGETSDVKSVTVAEFNAAAESQTQVYELVGTIGGTINSTYGNFDLTDDSGTVYVYGLTATELGYGAKNDQSYGSLGLAAGDKIKIHGYRGSYNGKIEVMYAWFIEKVDGGSDTPGGETSDVKSVTVAEFNAAAESQTQVYELVGTIGGTINSTYGNFDLTDDSGTVYVYGLTATELGYGAKNDQSYGSLGLAAGDKIKIHGYRGSYNGKIEVLNAWFIEKVDGGETPGGGGEQGGGSGSTDETGVTTVTVDKDYLTANQNGTLDSVISYTNDSSYTGTVTELRIYKGKNLRITAASGYTITEVDITAAKNNGGNHGNNESNPVTVDTGATATLTADTSVTTSTITVTGNTSFVNLNATAAQIRIVELTVKYKAVE